MHYVHRCVFCGWHREATSPTVLSPRCEQCGCALASLPASDWLEAQRSDSIVAPSRFAARLVRVATLAGLLLVAVAAARIGYGEGGSAIAVAAVGLAGLAGVVLAPGPAVPGPRS